MMDDEKIKAKDGYSYSFGLLSKMKWTLLGLAVLIGTLIVLRPSYVWMLAIISAYTIIVGAIRKVKPTKIIVNVLVSCLVVSLIIGIDRAVGTLSAVLSFIIIVVLLVAWKLWTGREQYLEAMRTVETMAFGDSLDNENFKDKGRKPTWQK